MPRASKRRTLDSKRFFIAVMKIIDLRLVDIALEQVSGSSFEHFFHAFYPALAGIEFVPLGGHHDGGADAFQENSLFEGGEQRPGIFYQATTQEAHRDKIRNTVKRLKEFGRDPKILYYVTSRGINAIDKEEEFLSDKLGVVIKIRDKKWVASNINHSLQTIAAFRSYLEPYLSFLEELGGATTGGESLFLRKLVLGVLAQASGKNLTRPLMPSAPRTSCVHAASPHHRKLGAGYATLPQMTGRRFGCHSRSPLALRTTGIQNDLRLPGTTSLRVRSPWLAASEFRLTYPLALYVYS